MEVMVDLETMGTSSRAAVVAIGAYKFDLDGTCHTQPVDSMAFYRNVDLQSSINAGLEPDGSTIMWWLSQSQEARDTLLDPKPIKLSQALHEFATWLLPTNDDPIKIWAHATFDLPILSNAYQAINKPQPWKYSNSRDVRTIYDLAYPNDKVPNIPDTNKHNAVYDAWRQAIGVQECYKKLGLGQRV